MTYTYTLRAVRTLSESVDCDEPRAALELAQLSAVELLKSGHAVTITVKPRKPNPAEPQPPLTHTAHLFH